VAEELAELAAQDLAFGYDGRLILRDLTLGFQAGGLFFLVGPNGAGKSTLLALLAGLLAPTQGRVLLRGQPLSSFSPRELARLLALAPQKSTFSLPFTVAEVVAMGRRPYLGRWGRLSPRDQEKVDLALTRLGLESLAGRPITTLSGGEAQRAVIARTLAQDTPVILLDEPTASLDIHQSLGLMGLLRELAAEGRAIIVVSHDLTLAAVYAQEMVFLKKGRLVASGPLAQTLTPELLELVFEAEARVWADEFTGGLAISWRPRPNLGPSAS
jgi:iron complex transport system ATP-binding protein